MAIAKKLNATLAAHLAAAHGPFQGVHSHPHSTFGSQGDDNNMHEHMHEHGGPGSKSASHDHHSQHAATVTADASWPTGQLSMTAAAHPDAEPTELATLLAAAYAEVPEGGSLVAAAMTALGAPFGVEQTGEEEWTLLGPDGAAESFTTYADAVGHLSSLAFVDSRPVLAETWRSEMAFEDAETPDGRYIAPGALAYRDCPMPLMLQTTTDIGHFGAVLAGSITKCGTTNGVALGSGEFDDSEAGRQFVATIAARGKFGVSIDGMSPAEAEFECTERDEEGDCVDGRMRFNLLTIGGVTGTPFPAFADAYIALENRGVSASGAPDEEPCADCDEERAASAAPVPMKEDPIPLGKSEPVTFAAVTAAGGPEAPPTGWFANPDFAPGDGRMVRQPDGSWACPLTVTADGRVFGHLANFSGCHTAYANQCVRPPRSSTGYAAFMLRPLMTADGNVVKVGHLTMGCGHAPTTGNMSADAVRAHYDGGPGAVRMASVAVGDDAHGIWFAGSLLPGVTDEQIRSFSQCSLSGDWREVWRGKGLELVACLGGVVSPGFPIAAAALAAAGLIGNVQPTEPAVAWTDGRAVALVAAGMVRQPLPWERTQAELLTRLEALEGRLDAAERVTQPLRADAFARVVADLEGAAVVPPSAVR